MKAERLAEAANLRAIGNQQAQTIKAVADRQSVEIVADANREMQYPSRRGRRAAAGDFRRCLWQGCRSSSTSIGRCRPIGNALQGRQTRPWCCRRIRSSSASSAATTPTGPAAASPCRRLRFSRPLRRPRAPPTRPRPASDRILQRARLGRRSGGAALRSLSRADEAGASGRPRSACFNNSCRRADKRRGRTYAAVRVAGVLTRRGSDGSVYRGAMLRAAGVFRAGCRSRPADASRAGLRAEVGVAARQAPPARRGQYRHFAPRRGIGDRFRMCRKARRSAICSMTAIPIADRGRAPCARRAASARASSSIAKGIIVTNNHVIDGADDILVFTDDGNALSRRASSAPTTRPTWPSLSIAPDETAAVRRVRRQRRRRGRRLGDGDRQPLRARRLGDARHRFGAQPRHQGRSL